ncbi:hypothetical protein U1Q18_030350, partial [Sarracenia purpurea var. burkii]
ASNPLCGALTIGVNAVALNVLISDNGTDRTMEKEGRERRTVDCPPVLRAHWFKDPSVLRAHWFEDPYILLKGPLALLLL